MPLKEQKHLLLLVLQALWSVCWPAARRLQQSPAAAWGLLLPAGLCLGVWAGLLHVLPNSCTEGYVPVILALTRVRWQANKTLLAS